MTKLFNRFADKVASMIAHVGFFIFCVLLVLIWAPSYFVIGNADTWQLIINTTTTIITFLLVALLHNTQHRGQIRQDARLKELIEKLDGASDPAKED